MRGFGALVLAVVAVAGCHRTFTGEAVQPNPLVRPLETLRSSEKITIIRGDMELDEPDPATSSASPLHTHKYPLFNQASFTVVSRDRLRFHVQIDHKWQDYADLNTWTVRLEDDKGRAWTPESIEHARTKILTTMWDREQRGQICGGSGPMSNRVNGRGDCNHVVGYSQDGSHRRQTLGSLSVFRGKADFVFYQRDLFHRDVLRLKLIVGRSGESFEFTWNFRDTIASTDLPDD